MVYLVGGKVQLASAMLLLSVLMLVQTASAGVNKYCPSVDQPIHTHKVTTEDGYILSVNRIAGRKNSTPVYLQHGLMESSNDWLFLQEKSLPCILAKQGYDVWLGNARGNTYSKEHKNYTVNSRRFWNFSWQEMGEYDVPAIINYIRNETGQDMFYIGYSMGSTMFSVMAIEKPEIAKKVKAAIHLAPATYINNMKSRGKLVAFLWPTIWKLSKYSKVYEFLPQSDFFDDFTKLVCHNPLLNGPVCGGVSIFGFQPKKRIIHEIFSNIPSGTSIKLFVHMLQQASGRPFHKFDYGYLGNQFKYTSSQPPRYDISKIKVPVAVYWSENDNFVGEEDAHRFYNETPNKLGIYKINDTQFNHIDFLRATDADNWVYGHVLQKLSEINKKFNDKL